MVSIHFERDFLIYIARQGSHNLHRIIYGLHIRVSHCARIHELINVLLLLFQRGVLGLYFINMS
jgi:hypothetical protein